MSKFFNTAGPVFQQKHYSIDPLRRFDLDNILLLIMQNKYFVLQAPRQTGKTSYLIALREYLNKEGTYKSLYINIEAAQAVRENVEQGMRVILRTLARDAKIYLDDPFLEENQEKLLSRGGAFMALQDALVDWCRNSTKPIVLLIDEIDSLVGDTLISVLRQLRGGYDKRPDMFPQSVILCGVRDVRDYRIHSDKEKTMITGGSAFNIKAESLRLGSFSRDEIKELFQQHTEATGQVFEADIFPLVWELTEGQPWLVNALAYETCFKMKEARDRSVPITAALIQQAKENLIQRRETHLDQLGDKLKEERIRRVIEPMLAGLDDVEAIPDDDIDYAVDLGLVRRKPQLVISNRIYKEVIPRQLTYSTQAKITHDTSWYVDADGRLDMEKLLTAFQEFFRKHFESWVQGFQYSEAGRQLLLQAFLQRIVNGGGRVERQYGLGLTRTDLLIIWPHENGIQEIVLELKIRYGRLDTIIKKGLEQTANYMDKCGTKEGYLLVFDKDPRKPWSKKIFKRTHTHKAYEIPVYGM